MDVTPITETTGLALALSLAEAREIQDELSRIHTKFDRLAELGKRIYSVIGPIEEPGF